MRPSIARVKDGVNYTTDNMPVGMVWNWLTVKEHEVERIKGHLRHFYICVCECGNICRVEGNNLISGHTKSCGCYRREVITTHGDRVVGSEYFRLHQCWAAMMNRCYNKNSDSYHTHGGRGITVCVAWRDSSVFKEWSLANGYSDKLTLDRENNESGNYEPSNCRWATAKQQARNRRDNHMITAFGETKCIAEWAEDVRCVVAAGTLRMRLKRGMEPEEAMTKYSRQSK